MTTLVDMLPSIILLALAALVFSFCVAVVESPYKRGMTFATTVMWLSALVFVIGVVAFPYASAVKQQTRIERLEKITKDQSRMPQG